MKKDKLFRQYLLSYLCIFLIPLLILFVVIYGRTIRTIEQGTLKNNRAALQRVQANIEVQLDRLENAKDYLGADAVSARVNLN